MRLTTLAPILALLLIAPGLTLARARPASPPSPLVELTILDRDSGSIEPRYLARGQNWIAATPGHRYAVRLSNRSAGRVLVVLSVDGVNAIDGRTAAPDQAGYVLAPWQSTEVTGWRKSLTEVAAFHFTALPDSYAARTGRPDNVGVIGIAVFQERLPPPPPLALQHESATAAKAMRGGAPVAQSIGTGHGGRESSPVRTTTFERASRQPAQVTSLRYETRVNLIAWGVLPRPPHDRPRPHRPSAFPGGFVPDP